MNFYDHTPTYEWMKKQSPQVEKMGIQEFYKFQLKGCALDLAKPDNPEHEHRRLVTAYNQLATDVQWHKDGRPYYKVFPALIPMLANTKLAVPGKYLKAPQPTFAIRLPEGHQDPMFTVEGRELKSIVVSESSKDEILAIRGEVEQEKMFIIWIDFGETFSGMPYYLFQVMKFNEDDTIESALERQQTPEKTDTSTTSIGLNVPTEIINNCIKLVVSICFLATGADRIIEPDVLSKDLQKYLEAKKNSKRKSPEESDESVDKFQSRAKKRGKNGWTIGREITIPRNRDGSESDGEGRQLSYSHQRGAHFHVYHYGAGKSRWKVRWINQLTVRPDLPAPVGKRKGYAAK